LHTDISLLKIGNILRCCIYDNNDDDDDDNNNNNNNNKVKKSKAIPVTGLGGL
jgi:hypothetical protein